MRLHQYTDMLKRVCIVSKPKQRDNGDVVAWSRCDTIATETHRGQRALTAKIRILKIKPRLFLSK